jgi:hypothetical protein
MFGGVNGAQCKMRLGSQKITTVYGTRRFTSRGEHNIEQRSKQGVLYATLAQGFKQDFMNSLTKLLPKSRKNTSAIRYPWQECVDNALRHTDVSTTPALIAHAETTLYRRRQILSNADTSDERVALDAAIEKVQSARA